MSRKTKGTLPAGENFRFMDYAYLKPVYESRNYVQNPFFGLSMEAIEFQFGRDMAACVYDYLIATGINLTTSNGPIVHKAPHQRVYSFLYIEEMDIEVDIIHCEFYLTCNSWTMADQDLLIQKIKRSNFHERSMPPNFSMKDYIIDRCHRYVNSDDTEIWAQSI